MAAQPADSFTIVGDYHGDGGLLLLDTVLGDDGSASDRLVISGGTAIGHDRARDRQCRRCRRFDVADGILVVEAIGGADDRDSAFALERPVAAGAFEYFLFKGGVSAGTGENWYLRSTMSSTSP